MGYPEPHQDYGLFGELCAFYKKHIAKAYALKYMSPGPIVSLNHDQTEFFEVDCFVRNCGCPVFNQVSYENTTLHSILLTQLIEL